jgi:deoxyribodipyrimidine photo-lyase
VPEEKIQEPWKLTDEEQNALNIHIGEDYPAPMIDLEASYKAIRDRR